MNKVNHPVVFPKADQARALVVLLHGYGADGANLIGLGEHWGTTLNDVAFMAPNGLAPCQDYPVGYQWFAMPEASPSLLDSAAVINHRAGDILPAVTQLIRAGKDHFRLDQDADIYLVGFSQGAMLALYVGFYSGLQVGGVVAYAGGLAPDAKRTIRHKPEVLLYHGREDQVVPAEASVMTHEALARQGITSHLELEAHLGHEISLKGLEAGGAFLTRLLKSKK